MKEATRAAIAHVDEWERLFRRKQWIGGIYESFVDAYEMPWSPVSASDAPEIERLHEKIGDWYYRARDKYEDANEQAWELKKRYWRIKAFRKRFTEVARYIAKIELGLPDDWEYPEDF